MAIKHTVDVSLVKKGHTKNTYDLYKLKELKKCIKDPVYFIETYMKIQHPTRGVINFELYDYQKELIELYAFNRFSVALLPRQSGKTTCAAGFLLWRAMFKPDSTILVASYQQSSASEIMQRIRFAYEEFPDFLRAGVLEYNKGTITFDNGSRIISSATTEKTGRGYALSLIYLDEFAFVDQRLAKEFWTSLSPTLSTGGDCIITSTPNAFDDQFATIWQGANDVYDSFGNLRPDGLGANGFKAYSIDWQDVPRSKSTEEFEREMREQIGDERWMREFECQFISFEETLISHLVLKQLKGIEPIAMTGRIRWYDDILPNRIYLIGLDPSMGTGGDNAAITAWRLPDMVQVGEWMYNKSDVPEQVSVLIDMLVHIHRELRNNPEQHGKPEIYWSVENNNLGEAVLRVIESTGEDKFPGDFVHEPRKKRKGFTTTNKNKIEACVRLKHLLENRKMFIKSMPLIHELNNFIRSNKSFKARLGKKDDIVMSTLLCLRVLNELQNWDEEIHDRLADIIDVDDENIEPTPAIFV